MNIEELLTSGIIERYFLGELSQEEESLLLSSKGKDHRIQSAFEAAEDKFMQLGLENSIAPSATVKKGLLQSIKQEEIGNVPKLNPFKTWFAIAAAITLILAIGSLILYNKANSLENELVILNKEKDALNQDVEDWSGSYLEIKEWLTYIENPEVSKLVLHGNDKLPEATTITYVNHKRQIVMVNTVGMPRLNEDKDFQLWADVDGEMIDMGLLPKNTTIATLKYIPNATSYNITIEPAGGSDHPTVSELISYVTL